MKNCWILNHLEHGSLVVLKKVCPVFLWHPLPILPQALCAAAGHSNSTSPTPITPPKKICALFPHTVLPRDSNSTSVSARTGTVPQQVVLYMSRTEDKQDEWWLHWHWNSFCFPAMRLSVIDTPDTYSIYIISFMIVTNWPRKHPSSKNRKSLGQKKNKMK